MCGIVCYVGSKSCSGLILEGLTKLEYRGYDSAGVAIHDGSKVAVVRAEGKLGRLATALAGHPLAGATGMGHTRWATHGRPSETNAHPHLVDGVAVIHNGILENHLVLRRELEEAGAKFASETDTEILAHLISRALARKADLMGAVREALGKVRGSYALAVIWDKEPKRIVVAKNASPLVIGVGDGEMFAASDVPAILSHTNRMIFLEEGEIAELTCDGAKIETLAGAPVNRPFKTINWTPVQAEKGGFKHFMLKEIHEQPRAIEDTLRGRVSVEGSGVATELMGLDDPSARRIRRVVLVACGTSYHAALVGKYWIESLAQVPSEVELASEYRARGPLVDPNDLIVAVSQSGETLDTLEAVRVARGGGARILAISNVLDSAIPRASDGALYTHAGPEIGVASTKCFSAQLAALFMLAVHLGRRRGTLEKPRAREMLEGLIKVPALIREITDASGAVAEIAQVHASARDFLFLGRGLSYPIALEGALKLKEISYVHAEGYAAGEMKHGPIALIDERMPVVVVMPSDGSLERIAGNVQEVLARGGKVIAIATRGERMIDRLDVARIDVPPCPVELTPLLTVVPLQLLAYHLADLKGSDIDQPRNLAKTVTVE
ncbi:MAG: glutamine--fructose-6-phosphate transaminase (isomerizing) [Proteobacteria bacterium]|jgi:glucosamine--fructose-6-phosphate aminotransferase (isomerizing)|nr:glutamine--fructose-6-phosphate transaminase (isomerizing) [Pseudomonadota bacterium]